MRRRRTVRDQRGVSLMLVLVTLVIFGLIVPVLGQFGSTNGVSGYVLKGNRFDRYAAEAGMQAAINWAETRSQRQAGRQGVHCPDFTTATPLNTNAGTNAQRSVTVRCAGFDRNGLPEATDSIPQYALLALGSGRAISLSGGGRLQTAGAWWSNGSISPGNVAVDASADYVGSPNGCGGIDASPCDTAANKSEADPDLPIEIPAVIPVDRPGPSDACELVDSRGSMTLEPGLHWDSATLDEIGDGHCGDVTIHLATGGPHIFDFQFFGGGRPDWKLVPRDRNATVRLVSDGWSAGGCTDGAGPVLFAGTFRLQVGDGATADLCGAEESGQKVSVAQVVHGTAPRNETSAPTVPVRWTVEDPNGSFDFPPSSPTTPASLLSDSECDPNRTCSGGFVEGTLRGERAQGDVQLTVPDPVPAGIGAKVDHLHLEITHREQNSEDIDQRRVWISAGIPGGGFDSECDLTDSGHDLPQADQFQTDRFDCDLTGVHLPYFPTGNLTITYEVVLKPRRGGDNPPQRTATLGLDSVQLTAVFARPTAQSSQPSGNVLQIDANGALHADGTVYLPRGDVTLKFGGVSSSTFTRGLIVQTIDASNFPNDPAFTPFSLPNGGNYTDRLATFQAFLDADPANPVLTARVRFCDAHPDGTDANVSAECSGITGGPAKILAWDSTR